MKDKVDKIFKILESIKIKYLLNGDMFFISLVLEEAVIKIVEDNNSGIDAAGITIKNGKIVLFINPQGIMKIINNNDELFPSFLELLIMHEVLHIIYNHFERGMKKEDKVLYNIASDYIINANIVEYFEKNNKFTKVLEIFKDTGLYKTQHAKKLEEILYDELKELKENQKKENQKNNNSNNNNNNNDNNNDNNSNNNNNEIEYDYDNVNIDKVKRIPSLKNYDTNKLSDNLKNKIEEIVATAAQLSNSNKQKGSGSAIIDSLLKYREYFNRKTLNEVLKKSIQNVLDKEIAYTWAKPRLSGLAMGKILPSEESEMLNYGNMVISIDESGSVSNEELENAIPLIFNLSKVFKEIHIIKHDEKINFYKIYNKNNIKSLKNDILVRKCCGGTSHKEVFEKINQIAKKNPNEFSVAIVISDMESDIEETKNILKKGIKPIFINTKNLIN